MTGFLGSGTRLFLARWLCQKWRDTAKKGVPGDNGNLLSRSRPQLRQAADLPGIYQAPNAVLGSLGAPGLPLEALSHQEDSSRWGILTIDLINKQPAGSIKMLFCISMTAH